VLDTGAGTGVGTTDVAEHVTVVLSVHAGLDSAAQRVEHALAEFLVGRWGQGAGNSGPCSTSGWARGDGVGRRVRSAVDTGGGDSCHGLGKVAVISQSADLVVGNRDETVLVLSLEVHVDNTTGPDLGHVITVESRNLTPGTGTVSVATIFSLCSC
jgi:hypothetical protein